MVDDLQKLNENISKLNSELEKDQFQLELGDIVGIVEASEYNADGEKANTVGFMLAMNTGALQVWFQEGLIRHKQPVYVVNDKDVDTLHYHYQGETVAIEDLVHRIVKVWVAKEWKIGIMSRYLRQTVISLHAIV